MICRLRDAMDGFDQIGSNVLGAVLNNVRVTNSYYRYGYGYGADGGKPRRKAKAKRDQSLLLQAAEPQQKDCQERNDYQRAMELVTTGLELNPIYADLIDTRGMIHFRMEQLDMAETDFKKCIALYPEKAPGRSGSYFHLAKVLEQMGDKQRAVSNLRKAIVLKGLSKEDLNEAEKLLTKLMQ